MPTARAVLFALVLIAACPGVGRAGGEEDSSAAAARAASITLSEVRERAAKMPLDQRNDIDKRIAVTVERVNKEAAAKGYATVAARLAAEFGMTTEALLDEKGDNGLSFGELVIARTLLANSDAAVTLHDLAGLRTDGLGWGAIAFGLRFHMEDFEDAIKAEGRVAMGLSKADGKAAPIGK